MKETKWLRILIPLLIILLSIDMAGRLFLSGSRADAAKPIKYEYKVVDVIVSKSSISEFEDLLNKMGSRGWTYDHSIMHRFKVFRRRF